MLLRTINKTIPSFITTLYFACSQATPSKSFYRREMPKQLIPFASSQGKLIFKEALEEGHCESFFTLVQHFITQNDISTCSTASMAMMLNALKVDPGTNWKGIWRWYDDFNIQHMHPSKIRDGLTLKQFNDLAALNSVRSMAFSPLQGSPQVKQSGLRQSNSNFFKGCVQLCTRQSYILMTLNFHRKTLGQTGTGHFSPLAAYNAKKDLVLILDVAKFKYDPYWCDIETVYESFEMLDAVSNQSRGFILNSQKINYNELANKYEPYQEDDSRLELNSKVKKEQLRERVLYLLNNTSQHSGLIGLLYDFSTCEFSQLQSGINLLSQEVGITSQDIGSIKSKLTPQAFFLLEAFRHTKIDSIIQLLLTMGLVRQPLLEKSIGIGQDRSEFNLYLRELCFRRGAYLLNA